MKKGKKKLILIILYVYFCVSLSLTLSIRSIRVLNYHAQVTTSHSQVSPRVQKTVEVF